MEILNKINDWAKGLLNVLGTLLGLSIFAEVLFGSFLGNYSVITNIVNVVETIGEKGFVGLIALLLVVHFATKK